MSDLLDESSFTQRLADELSHLPVSVVVTDPLVVVMSYGEGQPEVTINLGDLYKQYAENPDGLDVILRPLLTEIGWTVHEPRYHPKTVIEGVLPVFRNLMTAPMKDELATLSSEKGPYIYQELVDHPEEKLILQYVINLGDEMVELRTGDVLLCMPQIAQVSAQSVENLKRNVAEFGLTLNEVPVQGFNSRFYRAAIGKPDEPAPEMLERCCASVISIPPVLHEVEKSLDAEDGLLAIVPSPETLILSPDTTEVAVAEMGLLAAHLKHEALRPVSRFVWVLKNGALNAVRSVDLQEEESQEPE